MNPFAEILQAHGIPFTFGLGGETCFEGDSVSALTGQTAQQLLLAFESEQLCQQTVADVRRAALEQLAAW